MPLWRTHIYIGPTGVREVANKIRNAVPGGNVVEGTEHVYVTVQALERGAVLHNLIVDLNRFYFGKETFDWLAKRLVNSPTWGTSERPVLSEADAEFERKCRVADRQDEDGR
jgi:hypothetical protein